MFSDLLGPYYFGKVGRIQERDYKTKDGKEGKNYDVVFLFEGGKHTLSSTQDINSKLIVGNTYAIPLGFFTNAKLSFTKLFIRTRDNDPIFEVVNDELVQIN